MTVRIAISKDAGSAAPATKAQRLSKIEVYEVSLVTSPAVPDATIAIMKSVDPVPVEKQYHREVGIIKIDKIKKQVYAYALVPDKEDLQGDVCTKEDVEFAKNSFFKNLSTRNQKGSGIGGQHQVFEGIGYPIGGDIDIDGSYGKMIGIPADKCIPGGWLLGIQVTDEEVWKKVESGEITGVSIGCIGERTEIKSTDKTITDDQRGAIRKLIDNVFKAGGYVRVRPVDKAIDFNSSYTMQTFYDECPDMWESLMSAFWSIMYDDTNMPTFESKMAAIEESLTQFAAKIRTLFGITKNSDKVIDIISPNKDAAGSGADEGVLDMQITQEQLDKLIGESVTKALAPITEKLGAIETEVKKIADIEKSAAKIEKLEESDFAKAMTDSMEKLSDVVDQLATRVTGTNVRKDDNPEDPPKTEKTLEQKQKEAPSLMSAAKVNAG